MNVTEYLDGQRACKHDFACPEDASEDFKDGYKNQYDLEQILTEITERQARGTNSH